MHEAGDQEDREDAGAPAVAGAHGEVDGGAKDGGDHEVPAATPEVLEGDGSVGGVELRLELEASRDKERRDGGCAGEYELEGEVHVDAV